MSVRVVAAADTQPNAPWPAPCAEVSGDRPGPHARIEVGNQPGAAPGRPLGRHEHARRAAAGPRHRADGSGAAPAGRGDRDRTRADWSVTGASGPAAVGDVTVDCGNAGTVARFLPPAAAVLATGTVTLDGDPRMRERPLGPLLTALRRLGAQIPAKAAAVPFAMRAYGGLPGGDLVVDASSSSQLISGLLLAAPRFDAGLTVCAAGGRYPSAPHLAMTVQMLRAAGAVVDDSVAGRWMPWQPGPLRPATYVDRARPVVGVRLPGCGGGDRRAGAARPRGPPQTVQPGRLLPDLLTGPSAATAGWSADGELEVSGPAAAGRRRSRPVRVRRGRPHSDRRSPSSPTPPTRIRGVAHLRGQETDRLAALAQELGRIGARVEDTVRRPGRSTPRRCRPAGGVVLDPQRRPPAGDGVRGRRPAGRRRAGQRHRDHRQDRARFPAGAGRSCSQVPTSIDGAAHPNVTEPA